MLNLEIETSSAYWYRETNYLPFHEFSRSHYKNKLHVYTCLVTLTRNDT